MELLRSIDRFCARAGMSPSRFGWEAVRDARLVHDLRRGRRPGARMVARIRAFLAQGEAR